jgi:hypothetical protein
VVDADSMKIIVQYMNIGLIELSDYTLSTIAHLSIAANFLQISELIKQIEYCLDLYLCVSNWMEIMAIAEASSYTKLEKLAASFGLLTFKTMKPEYIPTIQKLYWYLSHPYLDTESELNVFLFGLEWITNMNFSEDAILLILCCLDIKNISTSDLQDIKKLITKFPNSISLKVVDLLLELSTAHNADISVTSLKKQKSVLSEMFTPEIYNESFNIVKDSRSRALTYTPSVPMWIVKDTKPEVIPHFMYTYTETQGFDKWMEVAEKNLWGWNVTGWGPNRLVVVCGEYGRGTGLFMKDVKVYDTLRKEWTWHGVELPPRRHSGVSVINDSMYIIGGVGGFRLVSAFEIVY